MLLKVDADRCDVPHQQFGGFLKAEEHAARHQARTLAVGSINSLKETLAGLQGRPTRFGPRGSKEVAIAFEYWEPRWRRNMETAQKAIDRCQDQDLQQQLVGLNAEWVAILSTSVETASAVAETCVDGNVSTPDGLDAEAPLAPDRQPTTLSGLR